MGRLEDAGISTDDELKLAKIAIEFLEASNARLDKENTMLRKILQDHAHDV
jgi:hypothetical protein